MDDVYKEKKMVLVSHDNLTLMYAVLVAARMCKDAHYAVPFSARRPPDSNEDALYNALSDYDSFLSKGGA